MTLTDKDIRKYTERCQVNQGPPVMTGVWVGGGFGGRKNHRQVQQGLPGQNHDRYSVSSKSMYIDKATFSLLVYSIHPDYVRLIRCMQRKCE